MSNPTVAEAPVLNTWDAQKVKLMADFPALTEEDLQYEEGKRDEMLNKVQVKLGKTKEEMDVIIAAL